MVLALFSFLENEFRMGIKVNRKSFQFSSGDRRRVQSLKHLDSRRRRQRGGGYNDDEAIG